VFEEVHDQEAKTTRVVAQVKDGTEAVVDQTLKGPSADCRAFYRSNTSEKTTPQSNRTFDQECKSRRHLQEREADFLDRPARISDRIQPYSNAAVGIAVAAVMIATSVRIIGGWTVADPRFGIFIAAILATGLLAGVPAAVGAAIASILVVDWAFIRPYFASGRALLIRSVSSLLPWRRLSPSIFRIVVGWCCGDCISVSLRTGRSPMN
jgi:K+-sensing histidine kinase KdpD